MQTRTLLGTILLTVIACLLAWNAAGRQPVTVAAPLPDPSDSPGSIAVSGSSAIRVQPDRVVIIFGVETFADTPRASQAQNARLTRAVLAAIRQHGIPDRDVATDHYTIWPRYDDYDANLISGYETTNGIAVTLRSVHKLEPVLIAALEAGASTVQDVQFSVTNLRELRDRAREQAVQAALEKAAAMAAAADMTVGTVTGIREDTWYSGYWGARSAGRQWTNYQNVVQDLSNAGAIQLENGTVSLGQIVVQAQVSLTAELLPPVSLHERR